MNTFHLHLVSDSTGETALLMARACLVQFDGVEAIEHHWPMVRTIENIGNVLEGIKENPGFVVCTLVNEEAQYSLENGCRHLQVPCIPMMDPLVAALGSYLGVKSRARPGGQHVMDDEYFCAY